MLTTSASSFLAETERRIGINEGRRPVRYRDSLGIWTIGIGFNLERDDASSMLKACGADYAHVIANGALTDPQIAALFNRCLSGIEDAARASLTPGAFDALSDARRFVLCDLEYNLGQRGWLGFATTRSLLSEAQAQKAAGRTDIARQLFSVAADHLAASAWDGQVGNRASRDVAMIRSGNWCDANGNGSA